jgi:hypothetical protein
MVKTVKEVDFLQLNTAFLVTVSPMPMVGDAS